MEINKIVFQYFEIPVENINLKSRKRELVTARQISMYFHKEFTKLSLASIGEVCGNKDHATVLHAIKTVNNLIDTDPKFRKDIAELEKRMDTLTGNNMKLRYNDHAYIESDGMIFSIKIVSYNKFTDKYCCVYLQNGIAIRTFDISDNEIFLINPCSLYDIAYIEDVKPVDFSLFRILKPGGIVFIKTEFDNSGIIKFLKTQSLTIVDVMAIMWHRGFTNSNYLLALNGNNLEYIKPHFINSDYCKNVFQKMTEFKSNPKCVIIGETQHGGWDTFTKNGQSITIHHGTKTEKV